MARFASADSIVPGGAQGLDRYAYVNNSPVNFIDPSGHYNCEGESGSCTRQSQKEIEKFYRDNLKEKFGWKATPEVGMDILRLLYQVGSDILGYSNGVTGGKGPEWMQANLGGTTYTTLNPVDHGWVLPVVGANLVLLPSNLMGGGFGPPNEYAAHELGHIWDMRSGNGNLMRPFVGGVGDRLNAAINGSVSTSGACRWCNPGASAQYIPPDMRFGSEARQGYGNGSTADYLADAFVFRVFEPDNLPDPYVGTVIDVLVHYQATHQ